MTSCGAAAHGDDLLRLENVTLRIGGHRLLAGTSWTIRTGQHWVVLGPNGSGKTALTAALAGDVPVVAGRRWRHPKRLPEDRVVRVAFDTQQRLIARDEDEDESRAFAGGPDTGRCVRDLLPDRPPSLPGSLADRFAVAPLMDQPLRSLSTGELRRFMLYRALLRRPRLLILDEPFDGLDGGMRLHLADIMTSMAQCGIQIVLVTHRARECLPFMTHYLVLRDGRVREAGVLAVSSADRTGRPRRSPSGVASTGKTAAPSPAFPVSGAAPLIRMTAVSVRYGGRRVLRGLDWRVRRGENWLVSGPNGVGKSTLLRLVGADHPQAYANAIELFGRRRGSGESIWEIKRRIGTVSSELQVRYRRPISAYEVVLSGFFDSVGLFRLAGRAQQARARHWMERLRIAELAPRRFDRLSSGQQRLVLIARAVVKDPDLLLLDEPCQGLDARNRENVIAMVERIGRKTATSIIFTTHQIDERPAGLHHELALFRDGGWVHRRLC